MANTTIYPYGTNGQLPSSVGVINDLATGGTENALSAEMGKDIGDYILSNGNPYPEIEQGGLQADGTLLPSTNAYHRKRVRTKDFVQLKGAYTIRINSGYTFSAYYYLSDSESSYDTKAGIWTDELSGNYNGYVRLTIKRGEGEVVAFPSDVVVEIENKDERVSRIERLEDAAFEVSDVVLEQGGFNMIPEYRIMPPTDYYYPKRVRSAGYIKVNGKFVFIGNGDKQIFLYDANKNFVGRAYEAFVQSPVAEYEHVGYVRLLLLRGDKELDCSPADFVAQIKVNINDRVESAEKRLDTIEGCMPNVEFNKEYVGDKITIATNTYAVTDYVSIPNHGNNVVGLEQAMGIYGDYLFVFSYATSTATAYLYKFSTMQLLATLNLPISTYKRPHCNAVSFGRVFNSENSIVPLMYVSQWDFDSQRGCLVYDITLNDDTYNASLVQAILPTNVDTSIRGAGNLDWAVDPFGYIYSIGYYIGNSDSPHTVVGNKTMITKYKLPVIADGSEIVFGDADVLDHFDVPIYTYRQDIITNNGNILMLAGVHSAVEANVPCRLVVIDPTAKMVVSLVSLDEFNEEPEGIGIKDGRLLIGFRNDAKLYRFDFMGNYVGGAIKTANNYLFEKFQGKKVGIIGDSISTYSGWLPSDISGYSGATYAAYYPSGNVNSAAATWWYRMAQILGLNPATDISNCAWSGSKVTGDSTSTSSASAGCSTRRINDLTLRGFTPDIILVYISCNDWRDNVEVGTWAVTDAVPAEGTISTMRAAYALMLNKIHTTYPNARVFCCTNLDDPRRDATQGYPSNNGNGVTTSQWNDNIKEVAEAFGCDVINMHNCGLTYENMANFAVDGGTHPNAAGMAMMARKVASELLFKY